MPADANTDNAYEVTVRARYFTDTDDQDITVDVQDVGESPPSGGDVIITEIMQNPSAVSDVNGEWFEVFNTTGSAIDLNGWTIGDAGSESHTIAGSLVIGAGDFLVLGGNSNPATNGGAPVDYQYSGFTLSNTGDAIILTSDDATLIDQVAYDAGFPLSDGASMQLDPSTFDHVSNDSGTNWSASTSVYGNGDLGTPGAPNDFLL